MQKKINVADLEFGDIDARHEILARDETKRRLFLESFVPPPSFDISKLISGDRYIICGPKGSGKTAFLRYLQNKLTEEKDSVSRFIVFRDDITTQDREKLIALSQFRVYSSPENQDDDLGLDSLDCLSAWQLFIHREIAHVISRSRDLCGRTSDVEGYIKLLNSVFAQFKTSGFKNMIQKITKGRIKIHGLGAGFEAEAEFIDKHGNIDVSEFVRYCNGIVSQLDFNAERPDARINIFFDELNISFVTGADYRTNAILIRDLVAACGMVNSRMAEFNIPIYVYTAIRSEVADSVESSVRELQKWLDDKAVYIDWIVPNSDFASQPLLDLLERRIAANERRLRDLKAPPNKVRLEQYFEPRIRGIPFTHYLLFETWGRPRDLVRLLSITAKHVAANERFDTRAFNRSADEYSKSCWDEKRDELNVKYSQSMTETIKRLFFGHQGTFSRNEIESRISFHSTNDPRSKQFFEGRNLDIFLEDLFRVGVIGNIVKTKKGTAKPNYLYMGHRNFDAHEMMCVHRSLWRDLNIDSAATEISTQLQNRSSQARRGKN